MGKYFSNFGVPNISKYYLLGFLLMGVFPISNWVFYFSNYMSIETIGIIDGVTILIGIMAEIPTGALSDLIGKRKTLIIGYLLMAIACFMITFATSVPLFFIGNMTYFIGFAFISGAQEALAYDSLLEHGKTEMFSRVSSIYGVIVSFSFLSAMAIGGFAFSINPALPWALFGIYLALAMFISLSLIEPKVDTEVFNLSNYLKQLARGAKGLFSIKLRSLIFLIILISCVIELGQGLVRQTTAAYFGYNGETFGYFLAFATLISTLIIFNLEKVVRIFGEFKFLIVLIVSLILAYIIAYMTNNFVAGSFVILLLIGSARISTPFISILVNHRIESRDRATTISTLSLLRQIPYIVTVIFFAQITAIENIRSLFLIIVIGMIVLGLIGVVVKIFSENKQVRDSGS